MSNNKQFFDRKSYFASEGVELMIEITLASMRR